MRGIVRAVAWSLVVGAGGLAGCGGSVMSGNVSGSRGAVTLADLRGGGQYSLFVANGALVLSEAAGSASALTGPGLTDTATGLHYALTVEDGSLLLAASPSSAPAVAQIALMDSVTTGSYALVVVDGSLTLVAI